jgi:DNA-binding transcriptional ArsR family regulator
VTGDAGAVFDALGDPRRREVVQLLARGPATPTELARGLPISRQAVTKHLVILERAGLVSGSRQGREVRYRFDPAPLTEVLSWMARTGRAWDERLERLAAAFEQPRT